MLEAPGQVLTRHRAAVLGKPIAHSLSPVLHRAAYDALGMTHWSYDRRECEAAQLRELVAGLGPTWRGLSLTMPLKAEALLIATSSSEVARRTGAVNTLVRRGAGWHGDNTDVHGIRAALCDAGVRPETVPRAVIVGGGATARSALAALAELGVGDVCFLVRREVRASTVAQARDHGFGVEVVRIDDAAATVLAAQLVISTVPAGAGDGLALAMLDRAGRSGSVMSCAVLLDVVYAGWPTALAASAAAHGARIVPGIEMLIHQGAAQFELMTGQAAPLEVMQRAARAAAGVEA